MIPIPLPGCRHDILGHHLKAIGILRALATCAAAEHCDPDAEGWWDLATATFYMRSAKYPTIEDLVGFFGKHYRPTPVFSPWNTGGGMDEKEEIVFSINPKLWLEYWDAHREQLLAHGFPPPQTDTPPAFPCKFDLKLPVCSLPSTAAIEVRTITSGAKKPRTKISIEWSAAAITGFFSELNGQRNVLEQVIKFTDAVKKKFQGGKQDFVFDLQDKAAVSRLTASPHVFWDFRTKEKGKKAVMALLAKASKDDTAFTAALALGRELFERFQQDNADQNVLLEEFRDRSPDLASESLDAVYSTRAASRPVNNPLFLNRGKGEGGNDELFRTFWSYWHHFQNFRPAFTHAALSGTGFAEINGTDDDTNGIGTPFFPDSIKTYNHGAGWVAEAFPFNALDYLLAVEGAFALRGSASRTLAASSRRFAAFPFVFETGEEMTDENGNRRKTARALWLPLWDRPTTWTELSSFICDAQARLPGKEARFSSEFARALRAQGVDAGFAGWQEFRFKMKGCKVPWVVTGAYIGPARDHRPSLLADALHPLDESAFLDQFEEAYEGGKLVSQSPHPFRTRINAAIEAAIQDPSPASALAILEAIYAAARQTCVSKSFREMLHGEPRFFAPLPAAPWLELLRGEDSAEFRIARALASIVVFDGQADGKRSEAQPFLGSLLPLKLGQRGWYLPSDSSDLSKQAVWTGTDLCADLARVLGRRYLDSLKDDRPALLSRHPAPLGDVLAFLRNELDERLIARWTEALSLIGWDSRMQTKDAYSRDDFDGSPIPLAYAALRAVVDLECELQSGDRGEWKHRRSQRPVALLCQRSPSSLSLAVEDALRWCGIWGVPNPYGAASRALKPRLAGKEVVHVAACRLAFGDNADLVHRLPASVLVPIDDPQPLFRSVTLPQRES